MQIIDANGNMFGYDHLEIIGIDGKPKTTGGGGGPYVPYTGATGDVDLGEYELKAGQLELDQTPTGTAGVAVMRWNDQDGTADLGLKGGNVTLQIGQEQVTRVVNKTGSDLLEANYQAVRISGAQGNRLKVDLAQANNDANSADTIGIVTETILNNQEGFVTTSGLVRNIDTTGTLQGETWVDGDMLYLSGTIAGQITNVKPTAPIHTVIMGYVVRAHATQGQIYVKVDNGYELDELHNVAITSPANNDLLQYDSATSLWKNESLSTAGIQPTLVSGTDIKTINYSTILGAGNINTVVGLTGNDPITTAILTGGVGSISILQSSTSSNGYLSSTDWNTFNGKQAPLVSGTNIKTINGSSVLGSGDLTISGGGGAGIHVITKPYSGQGICLNVTTSTNNSTWSMPSNALNFFPFIPANNVTINQIVFEVSTASTSGTARITIYSDLNGKPNSRIFQSVSVATTSTGYKTITTTQTFTAGTTYWIGFCASSGGGAVRATPATSTFAISYTNGNGTQFTQNQWNYLITTSPGSEPTTVTGSLGAGFNPLPNFNLRVA